MTKPYPSDLLASALLCWRKGIGIPPNGLASSHDDRYIEAVVHELCHMAVFNVRRLPEANVDIGRYVTSSFDNYKDLYASDKAELKALLIERIVLRNLGIPVHWGALLHSALLRTSDPFTFEVRHAMVLLAGKYPHLIESRAARVRSWVDEAVRLHLAMPRSLARVVKSI